MVDKSQKKKIEYFETEIYLQIPIYAVICAHPACFCTPCCASSAEFSRKVQATPTESELLQQLDNAPSEFGTYLGMLRADLGTILAAHPAFVFIKCKNMAFRIAQLTQAPGHGQQDARQCNATAYC